MADVANMSKDEYREYRRERIRPNGSEINDARAIGYLSATASLAVGVLAATVETYGDEMPGHALQRIREVVSDLQEVIEDVNGKPATT